MNNVKNDKYYDVDSTHGARPTKFAMGEDDGDFDEIESEDQPANEKPRSGEVKRIRLGRRLRRCKPNGAKYSDGQGRW